VDLATIDIDGFRGQYLALVLLSRPRNGLVQAGAAVAGIIVLRELQTVVMKRSSRYRRNGQQQDQASGYQPSVSHGLV